MSKGLGSLPHGDPLLSLLEKHVNINGLTNSTEIRTNFLRCRRRDLIAFCSSLVFTVNETVGSNCALYFWRNVENAWSKADETVLGAKSGSGTCLYSLRFALRSAKTRSFIWALCFDCLIVFSQTKRTGSLSLNGRPSW